MPIVNSGQPRIVFITIAGNDIGYGHLSRCLALAGHAAARNVMISFWLFGDQAAFSRVVQAGFDCLLKPISTMNTGNLFSEPLPKHFDTFDVVITDISHQDIFPNMHCARKVFADIRRRAHKIVVIDALGVQALATKIPELPIDILIVPYVSQPLPTIAHWHTLEGPAFAVLSPAYDTFHERIVRLNADRILITCGGSDPTNRTPLILEGIEKISRMLNIRVIVGPLFTTSMRERLKTIVANSKHSIVIIDAPVTLVDHMQWCDMAVATSGLIKYELAATETPAVLLSIDPIHDLINQPFIKMGTAIDCGTRATAQLVADQVTSLLGNYEARSNMAIAGRKMVDGRGAERIINEILRPCVGVE